MISTERGFTVLTSTTLPKLVNLLSLVEVINPRRACAARVTVLGPCVSLSVCLSVCIRSQTTGYNTAHERY